MVDATLHALLHGVPHGEQVIPNIGVLATIHILPISATVVLAPFLYVNKIMQVINIGTCRQQARWVVALGKRTSANGINHPIVYAHAIGMERQKLVGLPLYVYLANRLKHILYGNVGHVSLACSSQATIERDVKARHARMFP